jgi:hypothetical protein
MMMMTAVQADMVGDSSANGEAANTTDADKTVDAIKVGSGRGYDDVDDDDDDDGDDDERRIKG